ncbi:MAG TPA: dihydroxyacetone kinase subunit DhaK [Candidatus Stercoripulliclostridium merdigallinarum]|uniref:phosphoenolpyruvate--glycerone phosphotransferase n=1 Tax=Candidatus Stercoripulliclostridium merdigallinarum TaxID=2840951 RepID=A0A9D1MIT4_9FIRM|nr:dihydroxyacetone kinase subunit DhaK [Candidatus Stercoripulliclostridium merdigallinarum]
MKKIMNTAESFVYDMCHGMAKAHPELEFVEKYKVVKKKVIDRDKVTLISGGGSGHEPAHAGFVGTGMLDAAVCGDIFASPSQIQVYNALKMTASKKGTLMIVKNYSGDCMNFNNAGALAKEDGIQVDAVYVNDDIAVKDSLYTVGRRGVAGTVFVHKIAGAAAEQGKSLAEVKAVAEKVIANIRSFGFALTSCTVPAAGSPTFEIGEDEMEFGVGIHGEPGRKREKLISADALAARIVPDIATDLGLKAGEEIALLINGFGGSPLQELYLFNNSVTNELEKAGVKIYKTLVGNYMTSIDMAGASVTFLRLDDELKAYLDYPVATPAITWGGSSKEDVAAREAIQALAKALNVTPATFAKKAEAVQEAAVEEEAGSYAFEGKPVIGEKINTPGMGKLVELMADIIIENEVPFCKADRCGDGDFGMSIAKGFKQLKKDWDSRKKGDVGEFLISCSEVIMEYCGGASGPIWGSAFRYAGKAVKGKKEIDLADLAAIFQAAVEGVQETGRKSFGKGAVVGDKTLIDALVPAADTLTAAAKEGMKMKAAMKKAAAAAVEGADKTKFIQAKMGRAGVTDSEGYPDAGAYGLGVIFTEICKRI